MPAIGQAANLSHEAVAPYTALMAASQPMISQQVLSAYTFRGHRCLLDIGGGDGSFIAEVAARTPKLRCVLFDLPAVADQASERFRSIGLSSRAVAIGGSFLTDRLPDGADIVSLVRVIHDHDDADVMTLLRAIRRTLPVDGTLLIAEPLSGVRGAEPIGDAYFAFYLLAMGSGRPRTFARLQRNARRGRLRRYRIAAGDNADAGQRHYRPGALRILLIELDSLKCQDSMTIAK